LFWVALFSRHPATVCLCILFIKRKIPTGLGQQRLKYSGALRKAAVEDADVHRIMMAVNNPVKPPSA
jgi:hypothetical protein